MQHIHSMTTEDGAEEEEVGDILMVDTVAEVKEENDVLLVEVGPNAVNSGASAYSICQYEDA